MSDKQLHEALRDLVETDGLSRFDPERIEALDTARTSLDGAERREPDWWIVETGGVPVRVVSSKGNAEKWASRDRLKFPGEKNILVIPAYRNTGEK